MLLMGLCCRLHKTRLRKNPVDGYFYLQLPQQEVYLKIKITYRIEIEKR